MMDKILFDLVTAIREHDKSNHIEEDILQAVECDYITTSNDYKEALK